MALTMLKLIGVELAPIAWIALTIYADVNGAEQVAGSRQGFSLQPISHDLGREGGVEGEGRWGGGGGGGVGWGVRDRLGVFF
jgi:hypothetical protein